MAKYFSLSPSTFADDFKAALEAYYGDGVAIESASGTTIIFQCPAVCDKVLKFTIQNAGFAGYFGDTSASMKQFASSYIGSNTVGFHLVLSDAFLLMESAVTGDGGNTAIVGKLTNGRCLVASGITGTNAAYINNNSSYFTDDGVAKAICLIAPHAYDIKHGGKMCLWPAFVATESQIEVNADDTFAKIPGLWLTSASSTEITVGSNFYLSKGPVYAKPSSFDVCPTRKYVELEVD